MNILQKILLPLGAAFALMLLLFIIVFKHYYDNMMNITFESNINLKEVEYKSTVDQIGAKSITNSSFYSGLKTVKKALNYYIDNNDIDSANAILENKYIALSRDFERNTERRFEMAFYSKEGVNIYRSWSEEYADNTRSDCKIIDSIITINRSVSLIGADAWGVSIIGATPVYNKDSVFIGIVETRFSVKELLNLINYTDGEDIAILIDKKIITQANYLNSEIFKDVLNNNFSIFDQTNSFQFDKRKSIKSSSAFKTGDVSDNYLFYSFPINNYNSTIGYVVHQVNIEQYISSRNSVNWIVFGAGIISLLIVVAILVIIGRTIITKPTRHIINSINKLSEGQVIEALNIKTRDEVSKIGISVNKLSKAYNRFIVFAKSIGEGDFNVEFSSLGEKDEMGNALLEMRDKLVTANKEEALRKKEEGDRAWANSGLYELGEMLRQTSDNINDLAYITLSYLVNYTNSNQGAIFLADDADSNNANFELSAAYAYERKKHMSKTIALGEGLIGTCAIEKETIFMDELPDNYINITSGLGKANPKSLIIVPLKVKDKVYGVLELASFNRYKDFEINFLENAAESIASTFSMSKINFITSQLLEHSQQQQEEMRAQEEEMRQNMEELQTTQEEALRRENEMNGILKALNESSLVLMLNTDLGIISINDKFSTLLGVPQERVEGMQVEDIIHITSEELSNLKQRLNSGETVNMETKVELSDNKEVWLRQLYYPILNDEDELIKIINVCEDLTIENKLNEYIKLQE